MDHVPADAQQSGVVEFQNLFLDLAHLFFEVVELGFEESVVDARLVNLLLQVFVHAGQPLNLVVCLLLLPVAELFEGGKGALVSVHESRHKIDNLGRYAGASCVSAKFERF